MSTLAVGPPGRRPLKRTQAGTRRLAELFTAKEALVGFAIGASVGFVLGVALAHVRVLQRGLLPYIVASQTIPILAIAPMVVVGFGSLEIYGWTPVDWLRVAVIAAYL